MSQEKMKANIKRIESEIRLTKDQLQTVQKLLPIATPNNVDQLLEDLNSNASKLGKLEMELDVEQEKLRATLGTTRELKLTLPNEVWERIEYEQKYNHESIEENIRGILMHFFFPSGLKN